MTNETPRSNRLHIGIFGAINSGKSSLINTLTGQEVSIVSPVAGTTTDPVLKNMELNGLGACVLIDTAGFEDTGALGVQRMEQTQKMVRQCDIALLVLSPQPGETEKELMNLFKQNSIPTLLVLTKTDTLPNGLEIQRELERQYNQKVIGFSSRTHAGLEELKEALSQVTVSRDGGEVSILGNLVTVGDRVILVMPQDTQAPVGRLILPQVQTLRELLDKGCIPICCTLEQYPTALSGLKQQPDLVITDSQVFKQVNELTPSNIRLTSFSILFANYKGDVASFIKGARSLDTLGGHAHILIAEACTHAPATEDIGRVKLPALLRKKLGQDIQFTICAGNDFPNDLTGFDLIIHCGGCMFNRTHVLHRIRMADKQGVPITNYGIALAHLNGMLDRVIHHHIINQLT